jgi:Zn-dependent protease
VDLLHSIDVGNLVIQFVVLLFSLSIHEASHAWTADYFGDYTARYMGRVTLNPIAHIDLVGTIIFPILQFVMHIPLIGWAKPVPINSVHLRNPRRDQILVSLAGPASNLAAAAGAFALLCALKFSSAHAGAMIDVMVRTYSIPHERTILAPILGLLFYTLIINFALALFNFLPIPPLDGHWLLYGVLPYNLGKALERVSSFGFALLYVLMFAGVLKFVFIPVEMVLEFLVRI